MLNNKKENCVILKAAGCVCDFVSILLSNGYEVYMVNQPGGKIYIKFAYIEEKSTNTELNF